MTRRIRGRSGVSAREVRWAAFVLVVCLSGGLVRGFFQPELAEWGDNAHFMVLGKALAEGEGMREINHPNKPPHTKYPIGFPLMLAAVQRLSPDSIVAMKVLVALTFVLATGLCLLVGGTLSTELGVASAVLFACNRLTIPLASQVMSEIPYTLFALLTLFAAIRAETIGADRRKLWLTVALVGAACAVLVRSVGIVMFATLAVRFAVGRRWRWVGLVAAVGAGTLFLQSALRAKGTAPYIDALFLVDYYDPALGYMSLTQWGARAALNAERYLGYLLPGSLIPFDSSALALWSVSAVALLGFVTLLRRGSILALYFGASIALLLLWPRIWAIHRYTVPLLPISVVLLFEGAQQLARLSSNLIPSAARCSAWSGKALLGALVAVLAVSNLSAAVQEAEAQGDGPYADYRSALAWVREHSAARSVVVCRKPFLGYWLSGRLTVPVPRSTDPDVFERFLAETGATHAVVDRLGLPGTREVLWRRIKSQPARYRLIHATPGPRSTMVFLIGRESG